MNSRVKDIAKIKLPMNYVLLEVTIKKSEILTPDGKIPEGYIEYCEIVNKHQSVTSYDIGDIVVDAGDITVNNFKGKNYAIVRSDTIRIAVSRDNFDFSNDKKSNNNMIISC